MSALTIKVVKVAAITVFMVCLAAIGVTVYALDQYMNRYDLQRNPIAKYMKESGAGKPWGTRMSLIPEIFTPSSLRSDVEQQLKDAGFTRIPADSMRARFFQDDLDQQRDIYAREANNLVCNIQLYVFVSFDQTGQLTFGESTAYEHGCS